MIKHWYKLHQIFDFIAAMKFLVVGALSAVVYFASFSLLWEIFHVNYKLAISIGYVLSVIFHFCANRRITFKAHSHQLTHQLIKYIVMVCINYLITLMVVHYVVKVLSLSPYFGIVASIACTVVSGYLMAKFWVFKHPKATKN